MGKKKQNKGKKSLPALVIAGILVVTGYMNLDEFIDFTGISEESEQKIESTVAEDEMKVTFLDVGQGDCTVVQAGEHNLVMDTGNNNQGEKVVDFLRKNGINKLDYLILSHPDADHIGGGDNVLENIEVEQVIMPDIANDTMTYEEVMEDIKKYDVDIINPEVGESYALGDAQFTILCPEEELVNENDMNGSSVGIKLVHGDKSFVMCGDAEKKSEQAMVERFGGNLECDVLKCGHHGSSTATIDEFLAMTDPTWAVISCGKDNSYGHPHWETIAKLEDSDAQIYRTDKLGTITAVSDGKTIHWSSEEK